MGMNGSRGRTKIIRRIKARRLREAKRAGVDTTDRAAVRRFSEQQTNALLNRLIEDARKKLLEKNGNP